jgi:hypothetical protein
VAKKKIDKKRIKTKAKKINDALFERAKDVEFKGRKQADLDADIIAIDSKEASRADLQAQMDLVDEELDDMYVALEDSCVDFRSGVEGHKDFGDDSPLYAAMGFVRKSERKSGLTRKKKDDGSDEK